MKKRKRSVDEGCLSTTVIMSEHNERFDPNSSGGDELQYRFTAYIVISIRRERQAYLKLRARRLQREILIDDVNLEETDDFTNTLGEQDRLRCVLGKLQDRERYIFCAKVLKGADFSQIAHELGMKYKSVATIYYRTAVKLRNMLGGER